MLQPSSSLKTFVCLQQAAQPTAYILGLCATRWSRWDPIRHESACHTCINPISVAPFVLLSCMYAGAGGSLQAALEHSLSSSLAGPLHEALRNNFDVSLIPAFERATRVSSLSLFVPLKPGDTVYAQQR